MTIVHQSGCGMSNYDNIKVIEQSGRLLIAYYMDGTKKIIAQYDSNERAHDVFKALADTMIDSHNIVALPEI